MSTLEFVKSQNFVKNIMLKFWTKYALIGYFCATVFEKVFHIWNHHPRICLTTKFCDESKMLKFGIKNTILQYFWPRMSYLGLFGQEFWKNYCKIWNQHPWIYLIAKLGEEATVSQFKTKSGILEYFGPRMSYSGFSG